MYVNDVGPQVEASLHLSPVRAGTIAFCLLGLIGWLDYASGKQVSLTLLYLLPVSTATWFVSHRFGIVFCILSAAIYMAITRAEPSSLAEDLWNVGIRLGVLLAFSILIEEIKAPAHRPGWFRRLRQMIALGVGISCLFAGLGWMIQTFLPARGWQSTAKDGEVPAVGPALELRQLASLATSSMRASRPVLLGSRDPRGPSCVTVVRTGDVHDVLPSTVGDYDGGPGTGIATLYGLGRNGNTSPQVDFAWHQGRLTSYLQNEAVLNEPLAMRAHELAEKAQRFAAMANSWTSWPPDVAPAGVAAADDWPSYCLRELDRAIAAKNLAATKHWAGELAAAAFWLDDLHRWLGFLVENHLLALRFQNDCGEMFQSAQTTPGTYDPMTSISMFPAGTLSLNGNGNYYEVERQAERLFSMPPDRMEEIALNRSLTAGSLWVPPATRKSFLQLESVLSPANQATWEQAARTPFEHSYLVGMLFHVQTAEAMAAQSLVLRRFDAVHPHATVGELMSSLMYRGHSFAGLEWGDRFQPQLLDAADAIPVHASDQDALMAAWRWTNQFLGRPEHYGVAWTLRDALEKGELDCVRATDMIGAIFRNAGRTRFGHVRWCAGTSAHSVAAYLGREGDTSRTLLVDGLMPADAPEIWPACYFHGHRWPAQPGVENPPTPYAVELYARGLDNYIWAEGYIIRGPHAGWLTKARIPYFTHRQAESSGKVFDGPYPS